MTLMCDQCDYDLRAQPEDGRCPECGMSVAESTEAARVPRRPAWAESDRWWRWRMLAGLWVLVLIPLPMILKLTGVSAHIPLPSLFGELDPDRRLSSDSLLWFLDPALTFFIGTVLLFGRERGRRPSRRDWLKRWGTLGSCIVTLIGLASLGFIASLVGLGISALFHSLPPENTPSIYGLIYHASHGYMLYGPQPADIAIQAQVAVSALVVLLACSPIYDALRAVGLKKLAWIIPAPLIALAAGTLLTIGIKWYYPPYSADLILSEYFFEPRVLDSRGFTSWLFSEYDPYTTSHRVQESIKWATLVVVASILTVTQFRAWRRRPATTADQTA